MPPATYAFGAALEIQRHRLSNGLEVLVVADPTAPVIAYQTWFAVGSRHEREGKTGIAHLFEHLMFNETKGLPYGEYDRRLEEAGADNNAATYLDWTYYQIDLPRDALGLALELEAERMQHLILREPQLESEREVVLNERRETVDDDVDGSVSELLYLTAFERHSYRFPTIGRAQDIEGLTTADCEAFYATHYAPNNARLVVVGDVAPDALLELVQGHYGHIAAAPIPDAEPETEPEQTSERRVRVTEATESARLAIGYKSPSMADRDHVAVTLVNEVLFGGRGSRVHRALVEELEVASDVSGYVGNFRDPSLWEMHVVGADGQAPERLSDALDRVIDTVAGSAASDPITDDECLRACNRMELSAYQDLESATGKAESIGFSDIVLGDPAAQLTRLARYRETTAEELRAASERWLRSTSRTVVEVASS